MINNQNGLSGHELGIVKAGLRVLQYELSNPARATDVAALLADEAGHLDHLSDQDLDALMAKMIAFSPDVDVMSTSEQKPVRIVLDVNAGVFNVLYSDGPVELIIMDADTEGADADGIVDFDGSDFYVTQMGSRGDAGETTYVQKVFTQVEQAMREFDELRARAQAGERS